MAGSTPPPQFRGPDQSNPPVDPRPPPKRDLTSLQVGVVPRDGVSRLRTFGGPLRPTLSWAMWERGKLTGSDLSMFLPTRPSFNRRDTRSRGTLRGPGGGPQPPSVSDPTKGPVRSRSGRVRRTGEKCLETGGEVCCLEGRITSGPSRYLDREREESQQTVLTGTGVKRRGRSEVGTRRPHYPIRKDGLFRSQPWVGVEKGCGQGNVPCLVVETRLGKRGLTTPVRSGSRGPLPSPKDRRFSQGGRWMDRGRGVKEGSRGGGIGLFQVPSSSDSGLLQTFEYREHSFPPRLSTPLQSRLHLPGGDPFAVTSPTRSHRTPIRRGSQLPSPDPSDRTVRPLLPRPCPRVLCRARTSKAPDPKPQFGGSCTHRAGVGTVDRSRRDALPPPIPSTREWKRGGVGGLAERQGSWEESVWVREVLGSRRGKRKTVVGEIHPLVGVEGAALRGLVICSSSLSFPVASVELFRRNPHFSRGGPATPPFPLCPETRTPSVTLHVRGLPDYYGPSASSFPPTVLPLPKKQSDNVDLKQKTET